MIRYQLYFGTIKAVEIEKETDKCYWVKGVRNSKKTSYTAMFDTLEDAKTYVIQKQMQKIENLKRQIKESESIIAVTENLKSL